MSARPSRLWVVLVPVALAAACGHGPPDRPEWVIDSRLAFLTDDLSTERPPLPLRQFRLTFPFVAGDLYGSPTTGDFFQPALGPDYRFRIDLNRAQQALSASLEPTNFSVSYLHVEPADARLARFAPLMLEADGIEQVGRLDWFDPDSRRDLVLLYLDRPATIRGKTVVRGRPLRYAIQAAAAGYVWVGRKSEADEDVYTALPKPARLLLAARPPSTDLPTTSRIRQNP